MGGIDAVLRHVLEVAPDIPFVDLVVGPIRIGGLREMLDFPQRRNAFGMVPEPDPAIGLGYMPLPLARAAHLGRDVPGVRDAFDDADAVILPGMERAFEIVARDLAAIAHVRAEVAAIGVEHPNLLILASPDDQIGREI